jgi:hypothetical protein
MSFRDIGGSLSPFVDLGTTVGTDPTVTLTSLIGTRFGFLDAANGVSEQLYRIGFGAPASLNVNVSGSNVGLSIIYDQNNNGVFDAGEQLATVPNVGNGVSIPLPQLQPGNYYIGVYDVPPTLPKSFSLGGSYSVGFAVTAPLSVGGSLNTITRDLGTVSTGGLGNGGFLGTEILDRVQLTGTSDLQVSFNGSGPVNLQIIRDANNNGVFDAGEEVTNSTSTPVALTNLVAGTYYLHLYRTQSTLETFQYGYSLSVSPSTPPPSGDSLATARSLIPGAAPTQDSVSTTQPNDFFKFTLDQSGIFTANLTGLTGDADVRLIQDKNSNGVIDPAQFYNPTTGLLDPGEILAWQWERGTGSETIRRFLNPGTYYVQVNSYNNQPANYTLGTTFTQAASDPQKFTITPVYDANLNATARATIQKAIDFWQNVILSVDPTQGNVLLPQNLTIPFGLDTTNRAPVNGGNGQLRWGTDGNGITRWTSGDVVIGSQYLSEMNSQPNLDPSIMIHEIGHVLGLITSRPNPTALQITGTTYPGNSYAGWVYGELLGNFLQTPVPVEGVHWSGPVFGYETMTPSSSTTNAFSQLSIAAVRDVGWTNISNINFGAAQPYALTTRGLAVGAPIAANRSRLDFNSLPVGNFFILNGNVSDTALNQIWPMFLRPTDRSLKLDLSNLTGNVNLKVIDDRNKNGIVDAGEEVANLTDPGLQPKSTTIPVTGTDSYYIVVYQGTPGQTAAFNLNAQSLAT